jgi:ribosome-binding factor A
MINRVDRVNALLEQEIGKLMHREVFLPNALATLNYVKTTGNLIEARVYVSVYPEEKTEEYFRLLKKETILIQREINRTVKMRPVPKIIFLKTEAPKKAGEVEKLLSQLKKEEK